MFKAQYLIKILNGIGSVTAKVDSYQVAKSSEDYGQDTDYWKVEILNGNSIIELSLLRFQNVNFKII